MLEHNINEYLKLTFLFYFLTCNNVAYATWNNSPSLPSDNESDKNDLFGELNNVNNIDGENAGFNEKELEFVTGNEQITNGLNNDNADSMERKKRSTFLIIPLQDGKHSRFQTGTNSFDTENVERRRDELIDSDLLSDNEIKSENIKRIVTDLGYGSRLRAMEGMANAWAKDALFGVHGPGKRSFVTGFGYGSRNKAVDNVATMMSRRTLFGEHGPGKRSLTIADDKAKRIPTDYGYGSRIKAIENMATSAGNSGLFGVYGPGKRSATSYVILPNKRIISDFGYGSREQIAETLAQNSDKDNVFGVYGPGKRSGDSMSGDSGYGSRIGAGSQVARDMEFIDELFGLHGPGR